MMLLKMKMKMKIVDLMIYNWCEGWPF
jgi:hypothetical protein